MERFSGDKELPGAVGEVSPGSGFPSNKLLIASKAHPLDEQFIRIILKRGFLNLSAAARCCLAHCLPVSDGGVGAIPCVLLVPIHSCVEVRNVWNLADKAMKQGIWQTR